jgi:hypothetical protein
MLVDHDWWMNGFAHQSRPGWQFYRFFLILARLAIQAWMAGFTVFLRFWPGLARLSQFVFWFACCRGQSGLTQTNLPTNQPTNQFTNQLASQPTSQPVSQPANQPTQRDT